MLPSCCNAWSVFSLKHSIIELIFLGRIQYWCSPAKFSLIHYFFHSLLNRPFAKSTILESKWHTGRRQMKSLYNLTWQFPLFLLSQLLVSCSPAWRFCTTWMTSCKGPIKPCTQALSQTLKTSHPEGMFSHKIKKRLGEFSLYFFRKWVSIGQLDTLLAKTLPEGQVFRSLPAGTVSVLRSHSSIIIIIIIIVINIKKPTNTLTQKNTPLYRTLETIPASLLHSFRASQWQSKEG